MTNFCKECSGILTSTVVENQSILNEKTMEKAYLQMKKADLIIILDSKCNSRFDSQLKNFFF